MPEKLLKKEQIEEMDFTVQHDYFLGLLSSIIGDFKHNPDLRPFLQNIFSLEYKDYVFKSKTIVISRTIRDLSDIISNEKELIKYYDKLVQFLEESNVRNLFKEKTYILEKQRNSKEKNRKNKNSNDALKLWMDGLSK